MPGKMAGSDPRPSVRITRGAGSGQHLASVLQEGRGNANIDTGLGFIWRISAHTGPDTPSAASSWSGTRQVLYSITKHAMRRSADEIGATSISFRPKVFSDPASVLDLIFPLLQYFGISHSQHFGIGTLSQPRVCNDAVEQYRELASQWGTCRAQR